MTPSSGAKLQASLSSDDRPQDQRIAVSLLGRYRLPSRQEYPCLSTEISLAELSILAPVRPPMGERVIVHLEEIGTLDVSINNLAALRRLVRDDDQRQFAYRSQGSRHKLVRRLAHRPDVLPLIRWSTQH